MFMCTNINIYLKPMLQPQEYFNSRDPIMASNTRSIIRLFVHSKCIEKCDLWFHSVIVKKTEKICIYLHI